MSENQEGLYRACVADFGAALERLALGYEADAELRRDLVQDIHLALWKSLARFRGDCSLRTWVYQVAHNAAANHVYRQQRGKAARWVGLDQMETAASSDNPEQAVGEARDLARLTMLVQALRPTDRQLVLLYMEGLDAAAIGDISGMSAGAVSTKIHRIKAVLARQFQCRSNP